MANDLFSASLPDEIFFGVTVKVRGNFEEGILVAINPSTATVAFQRDSERGAPYFGYSIGEFPLDAVSIA